MGTTATGRPRNRSWPEALKREIVAASFAPVAQDIEDARARRTGQTAHKQTSKDPNDISDEVLMGIVRATQDDKP
jgi:hypothetical protein